MARHLFLGTYIISFLMQYTSCQTFPTVVTPSGSIKGVVVPARGQDVTQFRKIPYARPPLEDLRFRKPVPIEPWTETMDGTVYGPSCMQDKTLLSEIQELIENQEMSEDCLHLNVYVPGAVSLTERKPVMVWIHGGAFLIGQGTAHDCSFFALKDVIAVTINYRLGAFGFLSTGDKEMQGNYGLWDQIAALRWVKKNIAAFGGDPETITIFGESSGGFAVSLLSVMPQNEGLFHRVIAQSGAATSLMTISNDPVRVAVGIGKHLGCVGEQESKVNTSTLTECLRKQSAESLLEAQIDPTTNMHYFGEYSLESLVWPVVDGELIHRHPRDSLNDPASKESLFYRSLDMMVGTTSNEGSLASFVFMTFEEPMQFSLEEGLPTSFLCDVLAPTVSRNMFNGETMVSDMLCRAYSTDDPIQQSRNIANLYADACFVAPSIQLLQFHAKDRESSNTYQFLFSEEIKFTFMFQQPKWMVGAGHGWDEVFMFGPKTFNALDKSLSTEEAKRFSDTFVTYWTNFAKTGDPNGEGLVKWKPYTTTDRNYMELKSTFTPGQNLYEKRMNLLLVDIPAALKSNVKTEL